MRIYCNSNIFGRPYDDLNQKRIRDEAIASFKVFLLSAIDFVSISTSEVLLAEISLVEDESKRDVIESLITSVSKDSIQINESIISLADEIIEECNVKDFMDALHIASACFLNAIYFITCDDELIDNSSKIEGVLNKRGYAINIRNPIVFIEEINVTK